MPVGFEPARQRYIASQKPNGLPTELSGRPRKLESGKFDSKQGKVRSNCGHPGYSTCIATKFHTAQIDSTLYALKLECSKLKSDGLCNNKQQIVHCLDVGWCPVSPAQNF